MKKSYIERLLDEIKRMFFELNPDATFDDRSKYQCDLIKDMNDEPEVIIKKSGGTWVARYDGVDYLYTKDDTKEPYFLTTSTKVPRREWQTISEIEITDDIAKLRPMVMILDNGYENCIEKLIAVDPSEEFFKHITISCDCFKYVRLATVSDLEES